jgi:hypothetical protein
VSGEKDMKTFMADGDVLNCRPSHGVVVVVVVWVWVWVVVVMAVTVVHYQFAQAGSACCCRGHLCRR